VTHEEEPRNFLPCTDDEIENDDDAVTRGLVQREPDDFDDYEGSDGCYICGGAGFVVTCIDDMCRGAGECMHGDGESPCPNGCALNL
jgi:hypothetical protein